MVIWDASPPKLLNGFGEILHGTVVCLSQRLHLVVWWRSHYRGLARRAKNVVFF